MLSVSVPYTLNAKTPTEFDRFAPIHHVKIDGDLASALALGEEGAAARSTIAASIRGSARSAGTMIHPEGSPISYRSCIVSTQNLTDAHITIAGHVLEQCARSVDSAEITVFLYILGRQVDYYVIDHESKAIIWAAGHVPESFQGATRAEHEHEYWIHMENFPGPRFSTPEDLCLLKEVLASNAIDALTSEGSTSPMSVQQIHAHLKSLESFSSSGDAHQTYAVARLWNLILQSRIISKYGTPEALLDRFITITDNPPVFASSYASNAKLMLNRDPKSVGQGRYKILKYGLPPPSPAEADICFQVSYVGIDPDVAGTSCQELDNTQPAPRTLRTLGRQTLGALKNLTGSIGVVPGLSHIVGAFEKMQNEIEDQEARFGRHLDALSSIIKPYTQVASHAQKNTNARSDSSQRLLELQNLIGSVRKTLFERTFIATSPYSHLLNAEKHQRNFEEATDSFRNWTNEWIIQTVTNLAKNFESLESRVHRLDNRIQGFHNFVQRVAPL